ncbi:MAG: gluconate 2-dehydrogenase subunit 3 family protein [Deltaproteobacteria bacterium]|nr:MAG: gluconate 2-dehydrogenase subunit 3 family protein [Deltaproteobacteria bacterium]
MDFGGEKELAVLNTREYKILSALTDRFIPRGGAFALGALDVGVAEAIDRMVSNLDRTMQTGLRMLLLLIEYSTFIFTRRFKPFTRLSPENQDKYLEGWESSRFYLRRFPITFLKLMCMSIFYSDERVEKDVGYEPACKDLNASF